MEKFSLKTTAREVLVDITPQVRSIVDKQAFADGLCFVYVPHTTAAVTINENADPSVKVDISDTLEKLIPAGAGYRHMEGNSDSHIKASLTGSSVLIAVERSTLQLGTWQGIQFCEFDGPRTRQIWVKLIGR